MVFELYSAVMLTHDVEGPAAGKRVLSYRLWPNGGIRGV